MAMAPPTPTSCSSAAAKTGRQGMRRRSRPQRGGLLPDRMRIGTVAGRPPSTARPGRRCAAGEVRALRLPSSRSSSVGLRLVQLLPRHPRRQRIVRLSGPAFCGGGLSFLNGPLRRQTRNHSPRLGFAARLALWCGSTTYPQSPGGLGAGRPVAASPRRLRPVPAVPRWSASQTADARRIFGQHLQDQLSQAIRDARD